MVSAISCRTTQRKTILGNYPGGGGGGATPRFWTPTTPPTKCWLEAPGGGEGRFGEGRRVQLGAFGTGAPLTPIGSLGWYL